MQTLGVYSSGGGNAHTKLRNQMRRLFGCTVQLTYKAENGEATVNAVIADRTEFWWNKPDERTLWDSKIELSEKFFNEIINRPVPLDMNILTALKRCSLGLEVPAAQAGEGADTGPGVGEGAEEGAVAEAHYVGSVDGAEQFPGLGDGELGGLAVQHGVLPAPHGGERVQSHGMARDQGIEEMPQGGQGLVLGGAVAGQLVDEAAGEARGDLAELEVLVLAPGEETANDAGVGAAGVGVGDAGGEELVGGKEGIGPGAPKDGGDRWGRIEGLGGGPEGGLGRGLNHGYIGDDNILYRAV